LSTDPKFVISNIIFASSLGFSTPNHWYLISGTTPQIAEDPHITKNSPPTIKFEYLKEADAVTTIADLLNPT
jgi:phospholipase C